MNETPFLYYSAIIILIKHFSISVYYLEISVQLTKKDQQI